jgi:2-keto-3-deoxy-6-phosphogluconate aldolase
MNDEPFNAVLCRSGPCAGAAGQLLERLRAATRRCPQGVLISAGCVLRAPRCLAAPGHDSGAYLLVQPCDLDRKPQGVAIGVGPVLSDADADAVAEWLAGGTLDARRLERRLRFAGRPAR